MTTDNMLNMSTEEYEVWLSSQSGISLFGEISEENLVDILKAAIMEVDPRAKASLLIDMANVSMALADKTLGVKGLVATAVVLKH